MKKILLYIFLNLVLFVTSVDAGLSKKTKFKLGNFYEGNVVWEGGVRMTLPDGKWEAVAKWEWTVNAVTANGITLVQLDGNLVKGMIDFSHVDSRGKWIGHIDDWMRSAMIVNKTDGCYERPEYYLVRYYKSGAGFNCWVVRHIDVKKEMYSPDKDIYKYSAYAAPPFKAWVRKNDIKLPSIMLWDEHLFYAKSVRNKILWVGYGINPELYGASKTKFGSEETSEYHRANIDEYPDKKKFMDNWVKLSAERQRNFERDVKAKKVHKLDLSEFGISELLEETKNKTLSSNIADELKVLNDLYKEGALTKEQYEKAKKLLLN